MQKSTLQYNFDDLLEDEEWLPSITRLMLQFVTEGIQISGQTIGIGIDYTLVNKDAAAWARKYAAKLVKQIDDTTKQVIRDAVGDFIDVPGTTIGDVIKRLPFDTQRAERVAVTEITKSYAQSNTILGHQMAQENPGVDVIRIWYTNRDSLTCPICAPLNGKRVKFGEPFDAENGIYAPGDPHINCRCWDAVTTDISGTALDE
jgi:SPP1 gp7 family putative phage head morphogenesis protein